MLPSRQIQWMVGRVRQEEMGDRAEVPGEEMLGSQLTYFGVQAYMGTTKHMGGLAATRELMELCHISRGAMVLDIGCGVGATACYLAKRVGCSVVGVDISEAMIAQAQERARREGIGDADEWHPADGLHPRVEFRAADAQDLPIEDGVFDVVLCESVVAFIEAKQRALSECARVAKPGGYVGLNEMTWLKMPPPPEMVEYAARTWELRAEIPTSEGWVRLLEGAELRDVEARTLALNVLRESTQIGRYHLQDLWGMFSRTLSLYLRSAAFRKYMRERRRPPRGLFKHLGYGVYIGRKCERRTCYEQHSQHRSSSSKGRGSE